MIPPLFDRPRSLVALVLATSLAIAPVAPRVALAEPTKAELDAARKKFQQALELEKTSDWKGALALLRDVASVKVTSQILFHEALCLEHLGKLVEARDVYVQAKEEAETREGAEGVTMTTKSTERIADLDARIPKLTLQVPEDVVSAKVSIDGAPPVSVLVSPTLSLNPGEHRVVVTSPGRRTFETKLVAKEKDPPVTLSVVLPLEEEPAPPPAAEPAKAATPHAAERPATTTGTDPLPYVLGGIGVVSLATAGVMYGLRAGTISDLDEQCGPARDQCPRTAKSIEDRGHTYSTVGNIFLGVGVVAVGSAIVLIVTQKPKRETRGVAVTSGPGLLGIGIGGAF